MYDKLKRARHIRKPEVQSIDTAHIGVGHRGRHIRKPEVQSTDASVGASATMMSICVMLSRITGFARTWAMAFALGSTFLSSSYQVANNLPNMLYELVMAGMLVTAFLPVYVSVKKKLGHEAGCEYASNLLTIVVIILGAVSLFSMAFPQIIIYTQTFYSDQESMGTATFLFQFFAIQTVFYGASSVVSGLLNANRNYFWSSIAPVANNVIVIVTFLMYAAIAPYNQTAALYIIAIGNPLGVFTQMIIQIPALKKSGIRLRPRINLHDPALKETLSLGLPAMLVMLCSFATVSVMNAASYRFADDGPSVLAYARLWYTLPYSILAVPLTTALFTELADLHADGDKEGMKKSIIGGTNQIIFLMVPFALYLVVFAFPLVTLYHVGAFSMESVSRIASYLVVLAIALPFYALCSYLQKVFSSLRRMGVYALLNLGASVIQILACVIAVIGKEAGLGITIESIALSNLLFCAIGSISMFIYLRYHFGTLGLRSTALTCVRAALFGGSGALIGAGILFVLENLIAPLNGSVLQAFIYVCIGGLCSLTITFGLAYKTGMPETAFVNSLINKLFHKLKRS